MLALRAWLGPDRMAALDVSPSQVRQALAANNSLSAVGQTKGALVQVNVSATTDLRSVDEFKQLVIRRSGATLVRLSDIADVVLGADDYDQDVRFSGERAVFMGVWVRPDASSLDVLKRVRAEIDQLQRELPAGMQARVAFDTSTYIDDAMTDVVKTLVDTVAIVMIVIFLFLGSLRTVVVPVVAIPVSLIGAGFLIQAFGYSMNLLTRLAIVLAVGLVVDDAIVVIENIERHVRSGKTRMRAALDGARELVAPIVAMTVTLAAAYVPIGTRAALTGALFREFAFTLVGAVLISGIVALTLSPVMSASVLRADAKRSWFGRRVDRTYDRLRDGYVRALDATLRYRPGVYAVWIALSLLVIPMYVLAPKELAPSEDQGVVFGAIETPANASLEQVSLYTEQVNRIYQAVPEAAHTFQVTYPGGGFGGMLTAPWTQRDRAIFAIQTELNRKLGAIAGIRAPAFLPPPLPNPGLLPVEFVIASTADHTQMIRFAQQLVQRAVASGQFAFPPNLDVKIDQQKAEIVVDRDQVAAMGQTMQQLGADLAAILGGNYVNRFDFDGRSYKVIPQIERIARLTPDQLAQVWVSGPAGRLVPLAAVAKIRDTVEPRSLNRLQQLNAIKISGVATRSVDSALRALEDAAADILPPGYHVDYTGESRQLREESGRFLPAIGLAVLLIFLVLAAQFNSFRDPFVILAGSVPLAIFGALIFAFLKFQGPPDLHFRLTEGWTTTLNIYSEVGLVTLAGLVAKNGILIVQFANAQQLLGAGKLDAVRAAARTRLRPILMVTAATVAGHFPLTLVSGPGAAARNSIGVVLVGGMSIGTLFTLFVVPSLYMLIARDHRRDRARLGTLVEDGDAKQPS